MAPMTRSRADERRVVVPATVEYYAQRADPERGAAIVVTEAVQVSAQGIGYPGTPGMHTAEQVAGWRTVVEAVHRVGGVVFAQLWHCGRASHSSWHGGAPPVAPSAVAPPGQVWGTAGLVASETPRALETAEIPGVVAQFRHAARCALEAGFDGVELHAANGYLVDQFLRDGTNLRTDPYGGPPERRIRFLREVVEALVAVWGTGRVGVRLSPTGSFGGMSDSNPKATFTVAAQMLNEYPLSFLHVVEGRPGTAMAPPAGVAPVARAMRDAYRGTFIVNGGYDAESGGEAIKSGAADLVAFGVPFLANPDLVERYRRNAPLNAPDASTFYGGGTKGYTDYPALAP
jgi:N-ethylmaleimide reductase